MSVTVTNVILLLVLGVVKVLT